VILDKPVGGSMEIDSRHEEMRQSAIKFHRKNPEIWRLFVQFTRQMIARGFKHYSAQHGIFARIRWEMDAGGDGSSEFKINNNYSAFYARAYMRMYPEHQGFFRTREQPSNDQPATNLPELTPDHYRAVS
tara:strand:- start:152 stop:541 length:390 start_codon:yes stop_codon:yes gene_type:complete